MIKALFTLWALFLSPAAFASEPIKIGDINSYSLDPKSVRPYENGVKMAIEEINNAGGVLGRKVQYLIRDDKGDPGEAIRLAQELLNRDGVSLFAGAWYNATAAAIASYAEKQKIPFFSTFSPGDQIVGENKRAYAFCLWPTTTSEASAIAVKAAQSGIKKWAVVVPTFDDGILAQKVFKAKLKELNPEAEIVYEYRYEAEKLNARSLIPVLTRADPEGLFFSALSPDFVSLSRAAKGQEWFKGEALFSLWNGYVGVRQAIGSELPKGSTVTGFPVETITTKAHLDFVERYKKRYNTLPHSGSFYGYTGYKFIAEVIKKAGSTKPEALREASTTARLKDSPLGEVFIDPVTHQSNRGVYVGQIQHKDSQTLLDNWQYILPIEPRGIK